MDGLKSTSHDFGESAYGRSKELDIMQDINDGLWCDCCKRKVKDPVLGMDVSNGEYGSMDLCYPCISKLVSDFTLKH